MKFVLPGFGSNQGQRLLSEWSAPDGLEVAKRAVNFHPQTMEKNRWRCVNTRSSGYSRQFTTTSLSNVADLSQKRIPHSLAQMLNNCFIRESSSTERKESDQTRTRPDEIHSLFICFCADMKNSVFLRLFLVLFSQGGCGPPFVLSWAVYSMQVKAWKSTG